MYASVRQNPAKFWALDPAGIHPARLAAARPGLSGAALRFAASLPRRRARGMGDVLDDAAAALRAAGYAGVSCRTERSPCPQCPTGYLDQNVCSAAGHTGGFTAELVAAAPLQQLQTERAYLISQGGGDDASYFDGVGVNMQPLRYSTGTTSTTSTNTSGGSGTPPAARPVTVAIENTSRPGLPFKAGDNWTLRISGAPNSAVSGSATFNGRDMGSSVFGNTDASGKLSIRGQFGAAEVGTWFERWSIAGLSETISFTVAAATSSSNPNNGGNTGAGAGSGSSGNSGGSSGAGDSKSGGGSSGSSFDLNSNIGGVPVWALGVGLVGAVFAFGGGKR